MIYLAIRDALSRLSAIIQSILGCYQSCTRPTTEDIKDMITWRTGLNELYKFRRQSARYEAGDA